MRVSNLLPLEALFVVFFFFFNLSRLEKYVNVFLVTAKIFISTFLSPFSFLSFRLLTGISHRSNIVLSYLCVCVLVWVELSFQCSFFWNRPEGITTSAIMLLGNVSSGRTTFAFVIVVGQLQRKTRKTNQNEILFSQRISYKRVNTLILC